MVSLPPPALQGTTNRSEERRLSSRLRLHRLEHAEWRPFELAVPAIVGDDADDPMLGLALLLLLYLDPAYATRLPSANRECATCHVMWLDEFKPHADTPPAD